MEEFFSQVRFYFCANFAKSIFCRTTREFSQRNKCTKLCAYDIVLFVQCLFQGDLEREKGMEVSPMMDRHNANVAKSQVYKKQCFIFVLECLETTF